MRLIVLTHRMDDGVCTPFDIGKTRIRCVRFTHLTAPFASARSSRANTMIRCAAE